LADSSALGLFLRCIALVVAISRSRCWGYCWGCSAALASFVPVAASRSGLSMRGTWSMALEVSDSPSTV